RRADARRALGDRRLLLPRQPAGRRPRRADARRGPGPRAQLRADQRAGRALHRPGRHAQPAGDHRRRLSRPERPEVRRPRRRGQRGWRMSTASLVPAPALGYTPFLEPIPVGEYWLLLLLPLVV